jgi:hypothetical protein
LHAYASFARGEREYIGRTTHYDSAPDSDFDGATAGFEHLTSHLRTRNLNENANSDIHIVRRGDYFGVRKIVRNDGGGVHPLL